PESSSLSLFTVNFNPSTATRETNPELINYQLP
ncbi:MAG: hypothetical protein ACI9VO_002252, partial [Colwellia sp.]